VSPTVGGTVQVVVAGLAMGAIYALMAIGFTMLYNAMGVINFAQGDILMLGAVFGYTAYVQWRLGFALSLVAAALGTALTGVVMNRLLFQPLLGKPPLNMVIATVGASIFIRAVALIVWGSQALYFPAVLGSRPVHLAGVTVPSYDFWVVGIALAAIGLMELFFRRTLTGKAMRATAQDRDAAQLMGVPVHRMDALASAISAGLSGIGGILIAPIFFVQTTMGELAGLKGFAAAVFGGFGSVAGGIVGGAGLGVVENLAASLISSTYKDAVAFVILIAVLFWRPSGLLGRSR
jgi:branched-chain amino acid transport system permease protein